jgi:hypothetical protein
MAVMRKRFRVLLLAAIVAAVVVPVGFALSLESEPTTVRHATLESRAAATIVSSQLVVETSPAPAVANGLRPMVGAAKLLAAGTLLFGLAAAVKKSA